jgi:hypothetical protein
VDTAPLREVREAQQTAVDSLLSHSVQPGDTLTVFTHGERLFKRLVVHSRTIDTLFRHTPASQPFPAVVTDVGRALSKRTRPGQPCAFVILGNESDVLSMAHFRSLPRGSRVFLVGRVAGDLGAFLPQLPYDVVVSDPILLAQATAQLRQAIHGLRPLRVMPIPWGVLGVFLVALVSPKLYRVSTERHRRRLCREPLVARVWSEELSDYKKVELSQGQTYLHEERGAPRFTLTRDAAQVRLAPQEEVTWQGKRNGRAVLLTGPGTLRRGRRTLVYSHGLSPVEVIVLTRDETKRLGEGD